MSEAKIFEVSVIIFREEDSVEAAFTALALEMSVRGYGPTPDDAIEDLVEMLKAQVSYAVQMGHPESVWHPAEDKYWRMWEGARRERFVAEASGTEPSTERIADLVPLDLLALKYQDEWIAGRA